MHHQTIEKVEKHEFVEACKAAGRNRLLNYAIATLWAVYLMEGVAGVQETLANDAEHEFSFYKNDLYGKE